MRRTFLAVALVSATVATTPVLAQDSSNQRKVSKEADLKKASSAAPDKSLAGDLTRKKESGPTGPSLQYDQFRLGVELQVASKRHDQIESLKKIIAFSPGGGDSKEMPTLLFRLGELYWEESKYFFFEANRKDDELSAIVGEDPAAKQRITDERAALMAKSKDFGKLAVDQYSTIVQNYKDYERTDEVLYFLGKNLMEANEDRKALVAYKRLIDKFPKSKYVPDAHLAYGEYYFNNSQGRREQLEKALDAYKKAASFPESQVYGFALYKQGWCYFNMSDYQRSMDMFKSVVLYGELAASTMEKEGGAGKGKSSLAREARMDFVRAYARFGTPAEARDVFSRVASKPEDRFQMMRQLANIYYDDGKDREAALTFNTLIRERPLSPEAPLFQGKIVDCVLRAGNKRMTVEQVRRLVKIMQDVEKAGVAKEDKDKKAIAAARELSERTLSNIAVNWHNEAKKTRDEDVFGLANEIYGDYLALFPDNPKAYDLRFFWAELLYDNLRRFEKAADEYTKVVMIDAKRLEQAKKDGKDKDHKDKDGKVVKAVKPGKWLEKAAYNAVLAHDEVVKEAVAKGTLKTEVRGTDKQPLPVQEQALVDACERYLKFVPNGEKQVEINFKAANLYYRRNHFEEAVARFSEIALKHPEYKFENNEKAGELAANLVLSAYEDLKDWGKLNEAARKFYANDKLASGKFRDELSKVLERSSFQLVKVLEKKEEYAQAAEAYVQFVSEFPSSEIADKALFNASVDFFKGKQLDKSIEMRQRLIEKYPRSPFVPSAMFANAEGLEAVGDFEQAADAYEVYARNYEKSLDKKPSKPVRGKKKKTPDPVPTAAKDKDGNPLPGWDESKAQIALLNAGIYREGLGQLRQAQKNRERFLELWPNAKDAEAVFLSIADLYEKMGQTNRALGQLEQYEKDNVRDPNKVLMAEGRISRMYEQRKRPRDVSRINRRIWDYYGKLGPKNRKGLDDAALEAVARAHNQEAEADYQRFSAIRLRWGRLPAPEKDFKAALAEKLRSLDTVKKAYTQTVSFKQGDPAVCALYKIGASYDHMVETLVNAPMHKAFPQEVQDALREEFGKTAQPLRAQATEAFASAVQKSRELNLDNDCADKALKLLREKYSPEQFPPVMEEVAELKNAKLVTTGSGILTAIQPVPTTFKRDATGPSEHQELGQRLRETVSSDSKPEPKPVQQTERKAPKPDSEPEDFL